MNTKDDNGFTPGVEYPSPYNEFAVRLCESAVRLVRIQSPHLDPRIFDNEAISDALSRVARRDASSEVRILIRDSQNMIARGHRLMTLARRLPSSVHIRVLKEHPEISNETVVISDNSGVLYNPGDENPGFYEPDSRASASPHIDLFDRLWQFAKEDPEFRRLGL